ncbi:glycerol-3-phosphate dehydrogenase/oxidase [Roseateles flavus]|uniref:Glycerol-3-phosphate dehydrogenase/oxidase n=1 Tax=Roseateles flavus TaxID=3149041 RepID=A0ABV0GJS1_9BURK
MKRADSWAALRLHETEPLDLLVIGGGIAGAGVALEAARCGARVALVEARDFAGGTSSKSSKLVHGGLRYLAQGQVGLTRESVRERKALLRDMPGLVTPLRFLLPVRRGDRKGRRILGLGLAMYDFFAGRRTRQWHAPAAVLAQAPHLQEQDLAGGWSYLDAQTDDARLVLRVLAEARLHGALTLNHVAAESLIEAEGRVQGACLRDAASGETRVVQARVVVNATGAWADRLRQNLGEGPKLRPLRGSHLVFEAWRLPVAQALAFFHPRDGRPVFALPWEGRTLLGTTDLDHRDPLDREPGISAAEFDYLMQAVRAAFPSLDLGLEDVVSTFSGVRPVLDSGDRRDPSKEAREHLILAERGLLTVSGGKLTTFRASAIQALRRVQGRVPALQRLRPDAPLLRTPGIASLQAARALPPALRERLLARYGDATATLLTEARPGELQDIPHAQCCLAELRYACRHEAVLHLDDLLLRRSRIGLLLRDGGAALLHTLRPLVQETLGWNDERWDDECHRYRDRVLRCYGIPTEWRP